MPVTLQLPDGSTRAVDPGTRPIDVAEQIGKRLAAAAVAARVDGTIVDLGREFTAADEGRPVPFELLTDKSPDALAVLRHSCAHVMARAVMRLFPGTQLAFGPAEANGFYYDIDSPTRITEADFPRIEAEMKRIVGAAEPFERFERSTADGRRLVGDLGQTLKVEHIDENLAHKGDTVSFYRQGEFVDLCRGPHVPHAGRVGAFKLLSIAGAYWKGDDKRQQLQRLRGTAFFDQKALDAHLKQLEEAQKRDHRVLGRQLRLFTITQAAGQGLILWMPRGATVRYLLESFIREELLKRGYQPVYTPHIGNLNLYRTSGHFPYYADSQFPPMYMNPSVATADLWLSLLDKGRLTTEQEAQFLGVFRALAAGGVADASDDLPRYRLADVQADAKDLVATYPADGGDDAKQAALAAWLGGQEGYLLKPMNCPHHIQIYRTGAKSYRDLPVKLAEFGTVYRFEQSGELGGLTRVRGFTQDDAHLFVTPDQVEATLRAELELVLLVLRTLSLTDFRVRVSVRDPGSDKFVGDAEQWDRAEATLTKIAQESGLPYVVGVGEGAFYGPKIDFIVRDCIGREWQLGTVQLDYTLPERFGLEYTAADNTARRPVMIHRAPFGSMERFCGILIEHFAGAFPLWLAPEQVRVLTISEKSADYGKQVETALLTAGFRVTLDARAEKIGGKVAQGSLDKVPYLFVVGEKDAAAGTVSVRDESVPDQKKRDLGPKPLAEAVEMLAAEVRDKRVRAVTAPPADAPAAGGELFAD